MVVSHAAAEQLKRDWRRPLPVRIRINGVPAAGYRTNLMPAGDGSFYLYLNAIVRKEAGAGVGRLVMVEITFDAAYRNGPQHPMPKAFLTALKARPEAERNWRSFSPSRKKEILRYFAGLKTAEARTRNYDRAIAVLSGARGRFMARDWNSD